MGKGVTLAVRLVTRNGDGSGGGRLKVPSAPPRLLENFIRQGILAFQKLITGKQPLIFKLTLNAYPM
jgi:hypothetical protein